MNHLPERELKKAVAELEVDPLAAQDSEGLYNNSEGLMFCGQPDAALRQLKKAIAGNYCSYPAMDKDPLFDPVRHRTEFELLRQAGIKCQASFQAHRQQARAAIPERSENLN